MFEQKETKYKVIKYTSESNKCPIDEYVGSLRKNGRLKDCAKIDHCIEMLKTFGHQLPLINKSIAKKIDKDIYELRPLPHRIFYYDGKGCFVLLNSFEKKKNMTPKSEIKLAIKNANDYKRRNNGYNE